MVNSDQSTQRIEPNTSVFAATPVWKSSATDCGVSTFVSVSWSPIVAVDSVENLTARAGESAVVHVQVDAAGQDVRGALGTLSGVSRVDLAGTAGTVTTLEVHGEKGHDVRRDIAAAVVKRGWGLLELRQVRMSLEDVFLDLTTQEEEEEAAVAATEAVDE